MCVSFEACLRGTLGPDSCYSWAWGHRNSMYSVHSELSSWVLTCLQIQKRWLTLAVNHFHPNLVSYHVWLFLCVSISLANCIILFHLLELICLDILYKCFPSVLFSLPELVFIHQVLHHYQYINQVFQIPDIIGLSFVFMDVGKLILWVAGLKQDSFLNLASPYGPVLCLLNNVVEDPGLPLNIKKISDLNQTPSFKESHHTNTFWE